METARTPILVQALVCKQWNFTLYFTWTTWFNRLKVFFFLNIPISLISYYKSIIRTVKTSKQSRARHQDVLSIAKQLIVLPPPSYGKTSSTYCSWHRNRPSSHFSPQLFRWSRMVTCEPLYFITVTCLRFAMLNLIYFLICSHAV